MYGTFGIHFERLAIDIRRLHDAVESHAGASRRHAGESLKHAFEAGDALNTAKDQMDHGMFGKWLKNECRIPHATANLYMRLASGRNTIEAHADSQSVMNLGLNGVDQWLRTEKNKDKQATMTAAVESGHSRAIAKEYRTVTGRIESFLQPLTRVYDSFLGVLPQRSVDREHPPLSLFLSVPPDAESRAGAPWMKRSQSRRFSERFVRPNHGLMRPSKL